MGSDKEGDRRGGRGLMSTERVERLRALLRGRRRVDKRPGPGLSAA